jgi:surfeit locus 1 family protein
VTSGRRPEPDSPLAIGPISRKSFWAFIILMLVLTAIFIALGKWQVDRLAWKENLIATVAERMQLPPAPFPPMSQWPGLDADGWNYRPVSITGHFVPDQTVEVFTSLTEPKGRWSGPGVWVMTPFVLEAGGTVLVDRGFVPSEAASRFLDDPATPKGRLTLNGIARPSERTSFFTPKPDPAKRLQYARDLKELASMLDAGLTPVAPLYVDLPAGPPGALPQGGETVVDFPNSHLGYAITWFGFAILTVLMLAGWIYKQYHPDFDWHKYL